MHNPRQARVSGTQAATVRPRGNVYTFYPVSMGKSNIVRDSNITPWQYNRVNRQLLRPLGSSDDIQLQECGRTHSASLSRESDAAFSISVCLTADGDSVNCQQDACFAQAN
jgi:hypothetical protein